MTLKISSLSIFQRLSAFSWSTSSAAMMALLIFVFAGHATPANSQSQSCTSEDFASAVDEAGAAMRAYNLKAAPKLQVKIKQLTAHKDWHDSKDRKIAHDYLHDGRVAGLDTKSNELLSRIDQLGRSAEEGKPDCAQLAQLKAAGLELLAVMKTKSDYMIAKIDAELAPAKKPAAPPPEKKTAAAAPPQPKPQRAAPPPWQTDTARHPSPAANVPDAPVAGIPYDGFVPDETGYTIDEIRTATRGFFGTISTSLAQVIEHAFKSWGRPTAYVLGTEGGGAFLAGLRYGKGTFYPRIGHRRKIYWHGPSIGSDIGAAGARTMFLIYRMDDPDSIYRTFTGVDGSAFLVGGVGLTLLKGGKVIMAPIRTGLGLRIGASIGYIRFTPRATWNPF